ncbi:hypothetical protein POVWA2_052680 [Plasmodium ovale wallikeri]|uniref:Uncharacterized protein n=1 Tax=Plasmodium ovale wallikeri TaxID=864142 RepID=A0A1A8ZSD4_PLAOA|nr:hypothetical protein POVWA1_053410 [Plasmodium ovale wallikeri]SBT46798.1 hypothetical protein POVWA2_052680 [Plasmodium ovale wallikeri]
MFAETQKNGSYDRSDWCRDGGAETEEMDVMIEATGVAMGVCVCGGLGRYLGWMNNGLFFKNVRSEKV